MKRDKHECSQIVFKHEFRREIDFNEFCYLLPFGYCGCFDLSAYNFDFVEACKVDTCLLHVSSSPTQGSSTYIFSTVLFSPRRIFHSPR